MTSGFLNNGFFRGLAFRVVLFLSLALLPIGLIAVIQTKQIADQSERNAELSLIAVTEQAVADERTAFQETLGAGQALAVIVKLLRNDTERCSEFLELYKFGSPNYRLVGFIGKDGKMSCSSSDQVFDFSDTPNFQEAMERGTRSVVATERGRVTGEAVVVAITPVFEGDTLVGVVFTSIGRDDLNFAEFDDPAMSPVSLLTFNAAGQIVTSDQDKLAAQIELPALITLEQLTADTRQVFTAENSDGVERVYTIVPLVQGTVFAMSVWPIDTPLLKTDFSGRMTSVLPFVMWIASLIVAFWALNRLAITHIRKLGRQMRHFALNRTLPRKPLGDRLPAEIVAMEKSFLGMANSILQDEARLEDSLREKNILLKEVHHRVKNNLQLISSIMNMQIRQAPTPENKQVLLRLQDRILGLATVHKNLYHGNEMTRVDAGLLLREIVERSLAVGLDAKSDVSVSEDYDSIQIGPDDAAPLTLLASEAVTNALKYLPDSGVPDRKISISLKYTGAEAALLKIVNTSGGVPEESGTGLGSRLITAFARQLNGKLTQVDENGCYTLELAFPVPLADKEVYDY